MEAQEAVQIIKSYNIAEINEAMRFIQSAIYRRDCYKKYFEEMVKVYKEMLIVVQNEKQIDLNKKYWVTEWSWNPMCDGRIVCEETIREHAIINGIDCYFTNMNNRIYFKEDIYATKEEAIKVLSWQNNFGYDYNAIISRENDVRNFIKFENYQWKYK
jgi:hypothetical protein